MPRVVKKPIPPNVSDLLLDEESGTLKWRPDAKSYKMRGKPVGIQGNRGYAMVQIKKYQYYQHQVIWFMHHGAWPTQELDHIDGNKKNNRISNLRLSTRSKNLQNVHKPQGNNKLGVRGVSETEWGQLKARITVEGTTICLGNFNTLEAAELAYLKAKRRLHKHAYEGNE